MSSAVEWPGEWPAEDLEHLGCCPVCGESQRILLFDDLTDVNQRCAPGRWKLWKCSECGSGYLDPRATEHSILRAYASYPTHEVGDSDDDKRTGMRRFPALVRNSYINRKYGTRRTPTLPWAWPLMYLLPPPLRLEWDHYMRHLPKAVPGRNRLLDIGCGNGDFLVRAREAGWHVTGLDFDPAAANLVRSRGIEVYVGRLAEHPFTEASFDVVTANQVIEHVHAPVEWLRTCWRLVRPGGFLWIGTPNLNLPLAKKFGGHWTLHDCPRHITLFTQCSLSLAFQIAGIGTPRYLPRGWCIAWILQDSENIRNGALAHTVDYVRPALMASGAWREMVAWLRIAWGVELTAVARKPV